MKTLRPFVYCDNVSVYHLQKIYDMLKEQRPNIDFVVCNDFQPFLRFMLQNLGLNVEPYPISEVGFSINFRYVRDMFLPNEIIVSVDLPQTLYVADYLHEYSNQRNVIFHVV